MEIIVYGDVLFALNYLMDLSIILLTVMLLGIKLNIWRCSLAAFVMALYGVVSFVPQLSFLHSILGRCIIGILGVWFLGLPEGVKGVLKGGCILFIVAVSMGGMVYGLTMSGATYTGLDIAAINGNIYMDLPLWILVIGIAMLYILMIIFRRISTRNFSRRKIITDFTFNIDGCNYRTAALLDTGCELTMPVTDRGVLLVSSSVMSNHMPEGGMKMPISTSMGIGGIIVYYPQKVECNSRYFELAEEPVIGVTNICFADDALYSGVYNPKIVRKRINNGDKGHKYSLLKWRKDI